jgi:hypothetical protein
MKLFERVIFGGVIAAVSVLSFSCATQVREEKTTRQVEESVDPAEQIRRRNAELLGTEITEERIKDDLAGKIIFAYGPEEGEGRQLDVAWTIFAREIKEFAVQTVDGDDTAREIVVNVVFDDAPKSRERIEGAIRIRYEKDGEQWKFGSVRRAGERMQFQK